MESKTGNWIPTLKGRDIISHPAWSQPKLKPKEIVSECEIDKKA
jgi:hypothetical protein